VTVTSILLNRTGAPSPSSRLGDDQGFLARAPGRGGGAFVMQDAHLVAPAFASDLDIVGEPAAAALLPRAAGQREGKPFALIVNIFTAHRGARPFCPNTGFAEDSLK